MGLAFDNKMQEHADKRSNDDFEDMCWHDNRVHGVKIHNPREGWEYDIVFLIDHILEWIEMDERFRFWVAPATLAFHGAHNAKIDVVLTYRQHLDIDRIEREEISSGAEKKAGYTKYLFTIYFHNQINAITLEANGFTQSLTGVPILMNHQSFDDNEEVEQIAVADRNQLDSFTPNTPQSPGG